MHSVHFVLRSYFAFGGIGAIESLSLTDITIRVLRGQLFVFSGKTAAFLALKNQPRKLTHPALGAACTQVANQIERFGVRDQERFKNLAEAADNVKGVGSQMQNLIRLLARSRKVELDIISSQFGAVIAPDNLQSVFSFVEQRSKAAARSFVLPTTE